MAHEAPRLIGLDWGTTFLRAYLLAGAGKVLAVKTQPLGVMSARGADFAAAYHTIVAPWRQVDPQLPAIAAGMIGSTEGWVSAPYCPCPAGPAELAAALACITTPGDGDLHVIPGVASRNGAADVMRGEETQIAGALALRPDLAASATLVLPGTHAKWVAVMHGRIERFTTYMTGELFGLLRDHSILGRPAQKVAAESADSRPGDAFERGVRVARESGPGGIAPLLFQARALLLTHALRAQDTLEFLSGLLIGDEVRCARDGASPQVALVGDPALCERYRFALATFGIERTPVIDGAAPAGLWQIAAASGLVRPAAQHG